MFDVGWTFGWDQTTGWRLRGPVQRVSQAGAKFKSTRSYPPEFEKEYSYYGDQEPKLAMDIVDEVKNSLHAKALISPVSISSCLSSD